jgi:hypothetical protein
MRRKSSLCHFARSPRHAASVASLRWVHGFEIQTVPSLSKKAAEKEDLEQLRAQLRRELKIGDSELDDYIIDHLDKLGLLPVRPE